MPPVQHVNQSHTYQMCCHTRRREPPAINDAEADFEPHSCQCNVSGALAGSLLQVGPQRSVAQTKVGPPAEAC